MLLSESIAKQRKDILASDGSLYLRSVESTLPEPLLDDCDDFTLLMHQFPVCGMRWYFPEADSA